MKSSSGPNSLWEIDAPHFNVGIVVRDGVVKHSAPITAYMLNWKISRVQTYCDLMGWTLTKTSQSKSSQ